VSAVAIVVPDLLRQRFSEVPESVALVLDRTASLTYRQWEERSNAAARGLLACGVAAVDRVALVFDNQDWLDYAVSYLAVHKAGAVAVPLGSRFSGHELAEIVRHCDPRAIVTAGDRLVPDHISVPRHHLADLEAMRSTGAIQVDLAGSDLAEILYTSGTTGLPKGVACTHGGVLFHDQPPEAGERPGRASFVHAFPVGTNAGQEVLRVPLRRNDRIAVALAMFDPERYCAVVEERTVTRLQLVPAMAQLIVASRAWQGRDMSSVERIVVSSAPTPPTLLAALAQAFPGAAIWNTYALTEAGTARTLNTDAVARPGSVGLPAGGSEVLVVDAADHELAACAQGEILIRRPGAPARTYYRDPEATASTFAPGGWVRTGDVGFVDGEGYVYLVDRKKDLIIVGGLNVSSVEVEAVLYEHPAVSDAAVFGIEHPVLGQDVAAAVVAGSAVDAGELQAFVRDRLGEHKVPHRVVFVDELPRTASGKVRKTELRDRFRPAARATAAVAPRTPTEAALVAIWQEVLGRDHIGADDDFFELGGHSLAATQIMARIEDSLSVTLPVATIFDQPTPASLALVVEQAR
jgi:acyl-CoA synthetase (AMP-forming)/AMP-acid ligase II/acyl carrier protein